MSILSQIIIGLALLTLFALTVYVIKGDRETDRELEALDRRMRGVDEK